ncbi:MAG: hypothetical protein OER86_02955 [Phycisphaerae bacterium]|nr:hypothetical protein [Phycisphaerae bacterium]
MKILIGLSVLVCLALVTSSRRLWRLRRTTVGTMLTTGGWLMLGVGFVLGPHAGGLVEASQVEVLRPLVLVVLGWVGLMVGLGASAQLTRYVPPRVVGVAVMDALLSVGVVGAVAWLVIDWQAELSLGAGDLLPTVLLLAACAVAWSPEIRSLRRGCTEARPATMVLRSASGVGSILAIALLGFGLAGAAPPDPRGALAVAAFSLPQATVGLGVSLVVAVVVGVLGQWLMALAGRGEGEFLVVLLGVVSLAAGAGAAMGYAPILVAMLCGAVVVNLPGRALNRLQQTIIEAEQPIAMMLMLLAGMLLDPAIGVSGIWLVLVLFAARLLVKRGVVRRLVIRAVAAENRAGQRPALGVMRQNPVAIALATGFVLWSPPGGGVAAAGQVLTVVILVGLISDCFWLLVPWLTPALPVASVECGS